ncbi:hypothetical protein EDD28_0037 [Salana multivorans]|uniref:Uncharacterized protein n=1 Tax=Salana multivorans TaxID=120377 RepID=A0A3N2D7R3_9MICO|nr:hypothetical protein [Salana multivorans]ROR95484.1 hypothetical protein EDD28_0037 [Salana multivorans]
MAEDMVEQAARVMHEEVCCPLDPDGCDEPTGRQRTYARALYDAGRLRPEVTDEMVERAARAAFDRPGAFRGCLWSDPRGRDQTTEATRVEYRENARATLEAVLGVK